MSVPFNQKDLNDKVDSLYSEACEKYAEENNTEEAFMALLDEISGDIQIGSLTYSAGQTLKEIDPIAFRCGMADESDRYYEEFDSSNDKEDFIDEALEALDMEALN